MNTQHGPPISSPLILDPGSLTHEAKPTCSTLKTTIKTGAQLFQFGFCILVILLLFYHQDLFCKIIFIYFLIILYFILKILYSVSYLFCLVRMCCLSSYFNLSLPQSKYSSLFFFSFSPLFSLGIEGSIVSLTFVKTWID